MMDLPNEKRKCHHTGFTRSCRKLVTSGACERWITLFGLDRNTGQEMNKAQCIDDCLPHLMIENTQIERETGAAVESFRNSMVVQNDVLRVVWNPEQQRGMITDERKGGS